MLCYYNIGAHGLISVQSIEHDCDIHNIYILYTRLDCKMGTYIIYYTTHTHIICFNRSYLRVIAGNDAFFNGLLCAHILHRYIIIYLCVRRVYTYVRIRAYYIVKIAVYNCYARILFRTRRVSFPVVLPAYPEKEMRDKIDSLTSRQVLYNWKTCIPVL